MPDSNRKTVIEKPASDKIRSTVIQNPLDNAAADDARKTVLESTAAADVDNRRRTVVEHPAPADASSPDSDQISTIVFRSMVRPPMATLTAFDDGSTEQGEIWRLRQSRTTIGRANCDIVIPHDPDVSATHAEIVRQERDGGHQWQLVDRKSTNGVFVRVNRVILRNGRELMLGARRFLFKSQDIINSGDDSDSTQARATQKQAERRPEPMRKLGARLVEQTAEHFANEHILVPPRMKLGRDAGQCDICITDPFLNNCHAEFLQDAQQRWVIKDQSSRNGIWVRVPSKILDPGTEFLLGGQRFRFDPL